MQFPWQLASERELLVHTDSDWASCETSRRSKSGGVIRFCGYSIMHWCRMQDAIALSSAEAELKASCKGVQEALGLRTALEFLMNAPLPLDHFTDASATHGIIKRRGAGAIKHLTVRQLWIQEIMKKPGTCSFKIPRAVNPADALCSVGRVDSFNQHLRDMHFECARNPRLSEGG